MKKIVFFGSGYFVIPVIEVLKGNGLKLVVTNEQDGKLISYLKENDIPYLFTNLNNKEDVLKITSLNPDLGVLASYGAFIPQEVINAFPMGILNIHPSLLPEFKGPSPIQFTILSGNIKTGVSIIELDSEIDHGPIVAQKEVDLTGEETSKDLLESLFLEGAEMINIIIQKVNNGFQIQSIPQSTKNESWSFKIEKQHGKIDLSNPPKKDELLRKIRAYYPWPGVYLTVSLSGKEKILKLIPNDIVQVEGKNKMSYKDFINGYGKEAEDILIKLKLMS